MSGSGSNKGNSKNVFCDYFSLFRKSYLESRFDVLILRDSRSDASLPQEKQDKVSIVELKNGKVVFKQKPISFEKQSDTLQGEPLRYGLLGLHSKFSTEIVKFREMLEDRINQQSPPLTAFPDEHRPLIAKLAHERFVHCVMWHLGIN